MDAKSMLVERACRAAEVRARALRAVEVRDAGAVARAASAPCGPARDPRLADLEARDPELAALIDDEIRDMRTDDGIDPLVLTTHDGGVIVASLGGGRSSQYDPAPAPRRRLARLRRGA
jgi:hypothetical protein